MKTTLEAAKALAPQLIAWRRAFHRFPELGFEEERTSQKVVDLLSPLKYRIKHGIARTGVSAEIGEGGPIFAIRADMDGLPIQETNPVEYASQVPGVMHACGHDAHIAMALGAATLLAGEQFPGTVRFLFQPSEETTDLEGVSGAPRMIQEGAVEGVSAAIALHVDPAEPVGTIAVDDGPCSAGIDTLFATILGNGGHGAFPQLAVDPIYISGHVILALHGIKSRRVSPLEPAVLSIGSIHGGDANNVIPDRVDITGTIRYMNPEVQKQIHREIKRAFDISRSLGGDYLLKIQIDYPPMYNHPEMVEWIRRAAASLIGGENIQRPAQHMGAEDFGFFGKHAPAAMFNLGCRIENDERRLHDARMDLDEGCLPVGAAVLAETALGYLRNSGLQV